MGTQNSAHLVDRPEVVGAGCLYLKHREQTDEAGVNSVASTPRRPHGPHHLHVLDILPGELLASVIEALALGKQLQQCDRLLRAIGVNTWHVDIIHKEEQLFAQGRAICVLQPHT